jgi:hypothetical protein
MQRITRASNADTHPGLLVKTSTRCTTEEVQVERQAKAVAKANAAAEKQANIKKVAQLENKARDKVNEQTVRQTSSRYPGQRELEKRMLQVP